MGPQQAEDPQALASPQSILRSASCRGSGAGTHNAHPGWGGRLGRRAAPEENSPGVFWPILTSVLPNLIPVWTECSRELASVGQTCGPPCSPWPRARSHPGHVAATRKSNGKDTAQPGAPAQNNRVWAKSTERRTHPWPMRPPRHSTAIVDTKSREKSLNKCHTLNLSSYPEEFSSQSIDQACHTYVPKSKPG